MKKNRKIWIVLLAVVVAGVLLWILWPRQKMVVSYEAVPVERGTISNSVTATGTIEPITQVEVGTQVSGTISKIYVDYNSAVTTGQLLAELDRTTLEADLTSSQASLRAAESQFIYQEANYNRIKTLYDRGMVSASELETALYQYEQAQSTFERSQADIIRNQTNLGYAYIYSPINGVILDREVEEGQTVAASFSTPTLFTIAEDLTQMQVIADVDEADIGQVKEGQAVSFTVDAFPDDIFQGSVTQVRLQPTTTSNVVTYQVVIDAPNPDLKLMPGLTANITVFTMQKADIPVVPNRAFRFAPKGFAESSASDNAGRRYVWLQDDEGALDRREVRTGVTDGVFTEILDGVREGDKVVVGMQTISAAPPAEPGGNGENNPFMPGRPGGGRR